MTSEVDSNYSMYLRCSAVQNAEATCCQWRKTIGPDANEIDTWPHRRCLNLVSRLEIRRTVRTVVVSGWFGEPSIPASKALDFKFIIYFFLYVHLPYQQLTGQLQ